jgi:hypothetical protein
MLKGNELLQKVLQYGDLGKSDLARECGYASSDENGREIIDLTAFHQAVLEAKGIDIGHNNQDTSECGEVECNVLVDGCAKISFPKGIHRSPIGKYGIFIDEWDSYYPGCPFRVFTLDEELRIPKDSDCDPEYSDSFHSIASSVGDILVMQGDWLKSGERYIVEAQEDEWQFALEPMPWNGLKDSDKECLRLLVLPKSSVGDLLSLCHPEQESLFNQDQFETFEAALADSLRRALALKGSESARAFLAKFNLGESNVEESVARNWLHHDKISELPLLSKVLEENVINKILLED